LLSEEKIMDLTVSNLKSTMPVIADTRPSAEELQKAGEGFESMFLAMLLKGGRAGLPGDDLTGSAAVSSSLEMLDTQLAKDAAGRAGLGIAAAVVRQFSGGGVAP